MDLFQIYQKMEMGGHHRHTLKIKQSSRQSQNTEVYFTCLYHLDDLIYTYITAMSLTVGEHSTERLQILTRAIDFHPRMEDSQSK